MTAASRKPRTLPPRTSWLITPASDTTSPDVVDRNAANAPATTRAESRSPAVPPISCPGRSSTTASACPERASSGANIRPTSP